MDAFDFNRLIKDATAETYDPRAKRCWWWAHEWTMWALDGTGRQQERRCLRCGLTQRDTLSRTCLHDWTIKNDGMITDSQKVAIGRYYMQLCRRCGDMRRVDLK